MNRKERPYSKNGRAFQPTESGTQGFVQAIRLEADGEQVIPKNNTAKYFICKNVGSKDIELRFNDDDELNYWTLLPNEVLPVTINIMKTTIIKATSKGGKGTLECLLWG